MRPSLQVGLVVLLLVGLLAVGGDRALSWRRHQQQVAEEKVVVAAASTEVERLITISASTSKNDIEKLLAGSTADFRSELHKEAAELQTALSQNNVTSTGKVVSAGVVTVDGRTATVILAAVGSVKNKQTKEAEPRDYRLRVDLQRRGDHWLVSGLEFVA